MREHVIKQTSSRWDMVSGVCSSLTTNSPPRPAMCSHVHDRGFSCASGDRARVCVMATMPPSILRLIRRNDEI